MRYSVILFVMIIIFCACEEEKKEPLDCFDQNYAVDSYGCGNIFVYHFLDSTKALTVAINPDLIELSKDCQSFDLSNPIQGISVQLHVAGESQDSIYFNYCNDVAYMNMAEPKTYSLQSGILNFRTSTETLSEDLNSFYNATVELIDIAIPYGDSGQVVTGDYLFWEVRVGWFPG